jgi:hypothetical protein
LTLSISAFKAKGLLVVKVSDLSATVSYESGEQQKLLGKFECNALAKEELQNLIQSKAQYRNAQVVLRVPDNLSVIQDIVLPAYQV